MNRQDIYDFLAEYCVPPELLDDLREYMDAEEERAKEIAEVNEDPGDQVEDDFLKAIIDQRDMMVRPKKKWYNLADDFSHQGRARRTKKRGICFHHTAVKNGFGIQKKVLSGIKSGSIAVPKLLEWDNALDPDVEARAWALAARIRGVGQNQQGQSYHVFSCANSVLIFNLPFELVSWHGHGSNNFFIGFAWDALSSKQSPIVDDMMWDIEQTIKHARDEGHPCNEFTTHSAYSNKTYDPGAEFIETVMMPAAKQFGCTIDLDFSHGKGKPIRSVLAKA